MVGVIVNTRLAIILFVLKSINRFLKDVTLGNKHSSKQQLLHNGTDAQFSLSFKPKTMLS